LETKIIMNIDDVEDLSVEGVDTRDYPDFCDAYFAQGFWAETGKELTEDELIELGELYPEVLNEMAFQSLI